MKEAAKANTSTIGQALVAWAKGKGYEKVMGQSKGQEPGIMFKIANALVLSKIKAALGLDETHFFVFGAAPLKETSINYFASLDMPLFNMYGLSETTGSAT